jgi:hypothetical protein
MKGLIGQRVLAFLVLMLAIFVANWDQPQGAEERSIDVPTTKSGQFSSPDAITSDIRSKTKDLVRVKYNTMSDRDKAAKYGRIVSDYGSFAVLVKNKKTDISRSGLETQSIETSINLPGAKFDPILRPPVGTVQPGVAASDGNGYYIVQFGGIVNDDWLDSIRNAGVEVLQYVPNNSFFVYGSTAAIGKIASNSRVRWVGEYLPEQKLSPEIGRFVGELKGETAMFDVAVFFRADLREAGDRVSSAIRGKILNEITLPNNFFNVVRIEANPDDVAEIAKIADVVRIDPYTKPQIEDERAAQIVSGNFTSTTVLSPPGYDPLTQFGVNGQNVTVSIVDDGISIPGNGGFYITSANTVNGPLHGASPGATGGHGHLNASIVAGDAPFSALDPTGYNYGIGIAPKSNIINIPFLTAGYSGVEADTADGTVATDGANGVFGSISNNSWGNGTNANSYDSYAAQFDGFVRDASAGASIDPLTFVFSAGNSGSSGLTRPKVAKNVIAVGNSENIRTELGGTGSDNIDDLNGTSSRGLAADGRIKPDICAPGNIITGGGAGTGGSTFGFVAGTSNTVLRSGGTSHAAPQVAGAAALFTQFWKDQHSGENPSPALIKAAILNTAQEMTGVNTASAIPNGNEGWGRINMKYMFNTGVPIRYVNQTQTLSNVGENAVYSGSVSDATKPFRVSLVWTDPPGVGNPALVNNLDLTITVGANTYRGNVFTGGDSVTGGSNSTIDNVENVFLPAGIPAGTLVTITVNAAALNGDGTLGNVDTTDQHFGLVGYNFNFAPTAASSDLGGRITDQFGNSISRVLVALVSPNGSVNLVTHTNTFGYYRFPQVETGSTYVITPMHKRYSFDPESLVYMHLDEAMGLDFVAGSR